MSYIGLDIGDRRIGVSGSDASGLIANGVETITYARPRIAAERIVGICQERRASAIIVGWPLETSGRVGRQARKVERFINVLSSLTEIPIHRWDERMTTRMASRSLAEMGIRGQRRKGLLDQVAASIILQSWLDRQGDSVQDDGT
ncbi:MAG: Holliday junction resolvase RuvX [Myxococcota bacterium]|nr:Holliday junction resolvase RuvX [Myxococcota bacterium]